MLQKVLNTILSVFKKQDELTKELTQQITSQPAPASAHTEETEKKEPRLEPAEEDKLSKLYPHFAQLVRCFVLKARAEGMPVGIFCGLRTFEEQRALYGKGRDATGKVTDKKQVVTNAPPGLSSHNYGLAVDLVFDSDLAKPGWQWSWDNKYPWKRLAEMGKEQGLSPAYFWKSFPESPHFEQTYGLSYRELLSLYNEQGLSGVWAVLDKQRAESKLS